MTNNVRKFINSIQFIRYEHRNGNVSLPIEKTIANIYHCNGNEMVYWSGQNDTRHTVDISVRSTESQ